MEGPYGPEHVNAAAARRDEDSLLQHVTRLCQRYRESPELGWGEVEVIEQPHHQVLVHRMTWRGSTMVLLHNLAPEPALVGFELDDLEEGAELVDLLQPGTCTLDASGHTEIGLDAYGHRWLRVRREGDARLV